MGFDSHRYRGTAQHRENLMPAGWAGPAPGRWTADGHPVPARLTSRRAHRRAAWRPSSSQNHSRQPDGRRPDPSALGCSEAALCYHVVPMSTSVGIRELRQQASAILKRVVAGEAIVVTEHGHPIARIVPLRPSPLEQLMLEGRVTEAEGNLIDLLDEMGLPADPTGNVPPSAALAELRADER